MKTLASIAALSAFALTGCTPSTPESGDLFSELSQLCGNAYQGAVVGDDPRDADWAGQVLVMHVRDCTDDTIRIPLHVGEDRSRTWVVSRTEDGLRLKHDHRHEDGSEDVLTQYGGDTEGPVTGLRAEFPADEFSRDLFVREEIPVSVDNVWSMTLTDTTFTYALTRPDRNFQAVFDLTKTVEAPPAPWGFEE